MGQPAELPTTPRVVDTRISSSQGTIHTQAVAVPPGVRPTEALNPKEQRLGEVRAAIRNRDSAAFVALMPADASERQRLLQQSTAMFEAIQSGAFAIVKQILEWEPTALGRSKVERGQMLGHLARGWQTVRTTAYDRDYVEIARLLLEADADPDGSPYALTPLSSIAIIPPSAATIETARILLEHGATVDKRGTENYISTLATAAKYKNAPLVRLMLDVRTPRQATLDEAIAETPLEQSNEAIRMLLERGANINAELPGRPSPNRDAAWLAAGRARSYGERDLLLLLLRYRADPNRASGASNPPLMIVMHDHELMKALLDRGANPNFRGGNGTTPLHLAVNVPTQVTRLQGDTRPISALAPGLEPAARAKSVALLLQYGADPTIRDNAGNTPLMLAKREDTQIMQMLVAGGATVGPGEAASKRQFEAPVGPISWALLQRNDALATALVQRDGVSPVSDCGAIYYAARTGATSTLAALLARRAKGGAARDENGATPLIAAARHGQAEAVRLLLDQRAADVNETTPTRAETSAAGAGAQTALMAGAAAGHKSIVEELIRKGADVNRVDSLQQTALSYARRAGASDVVAILLKNGARN